MCKAVMERDQDNQKIGADNALIKAIKNVMKNTKQSFEETCVSMGISDTDMLRYNKMI